MKQRYNQLDTQHPKLKLKNKMQHPKLKLKNIHFIVVFYFLFFIW